MAFRRGESLYYITYELVPAPSGRVPSMPMGFSYDADPNWKGGERADTTREEIALGRRTSTLRTEDEFSNAASQGRGYEKGKVYSVGDGTYVKIKSISKINPGALTPEQWVRISETERWSPEYLTQKYGRAFRPEDFTEQQFIDATTTDMRNRVDAVVAVSKIEGNGKVAGGTGWATEGALMKGIPVYVFDQVENRWYFADSPQRSYSGWRAVDGPPTDVQSIAGIGTRELTETGYNEIVSYVDSLGKDVVIHSGGAAGADTAFEETHAKNGGKVVSHSFEGQDRTSRVKGELVHTKAQIQATRSEVEDIARSLGKSISWTKARKPGDKTVELIARNMYQFEPGKADAVVRTVEGTDTPSGEIVGDMPRGIKRTQTVQETAATEAAAAARQGLRERRTDANNVYSGNKEDAFLAALTNRTNDLSRTKEGWATDSLSKGVTKSRYPVVYQGKIYPSAEHAYKTFVPRESGYLTVGDQDVSLMAGIIAEKLRQHPRLLSTLQARAQQAGGLKEYISGLIHVTAAGGRWEGAGLESPFLQALLDGAQQAFDNPETTEPSDLIRWAQDPKNQQNFPKRGSVTRAEPVEVGRVLPVTGQGQVQEPRRPAEISPGFMPQAPMAPAEGEERPQDVVAKLLNEFAGMREVAAGSSTVGSKIDMGSLDPMAQEQLARSLGASGPFGFRFDSLNREAVPGIDPKRTVGARIAALAADMGVSLPPGMDFFDTSKPFVMTKEQVAQIMSDLFVAIRAWNTVDTDKANKVGMADLGNRRAEIAALTLELARTLYDVGDPRSAAILKSLSRAGDPRFLGRASEGAEVAAMGVPMLEKGQVGQVRGRNILALLRKVAAAQIGAVPQSAIGLSSPSVYRTLAADMAPVRKKTLRLPPLEGQKDPRMVDIETDTAVHDLQRVVDEVGIFDGVDDRASIDLVPYVTGSQETLKRTVASPLGDLIGLDDALEPIKRHTSVERLDRSDGLAFKYRTGFKYLSRLGSGAEKLPLIEPGDTEDIKSAKLAAERESKIKRARDFILKAESYLTNRKKPGIAFVAGPRDAEISLAIKQAKQAIAKLTATESFSLPDFESEFEAELAPKFGEEGAWGQMHGVEISAGQATERLNSRGWMYLFIDSEQPEKVKLPQWYLNEQRAKYARWKSALDDVAAIHGQDFAKAYMASEEGIMLHGKEPAPFKEDFVILEPGSYVLPGTVADEIARLQPQLIQSYETTDADGIARIEGNDDAVTKGAEASPVNEFRISLEPSISSQYIVLKNGSVVSARSEESGFIPHRKVYPFQVLRNPDGTYKIRRLEGYEYENTDPNQRYSQKRLSAFLKELDRAFSGADPELDPMNLMTELSTAIAFDGYSALEILAANGDTFPQLEAEIISSITNEQGVFRTSLAPKWTDAHVPHLTTSTEATKAERAMRSTSPLALERETAASVKIEPMRGSTEPRGVLPGMPTTRVTDYGQPTEDGTLRVAESSQLLYSQRNSGDILGQTLTRDQALAAVSPSVRSVYERLGTVPGADGRLGVSVHDMIANPERYGYSFRGEPITEDGGAALYIIRALRFLQRAAEEAAVNAGYGQRTSGKRKVIMISDRSTAEGLAGDDTIFEVARATRDAALLAAQAAVEASRGLLRMSWSDGLDPLYSRHRFDPKPSARSGYDEYAYPMWRLLEPAVIEYFGPEAVSTVRSMISAGGPATMRASGALGDKATAFFNAFYRSKGLPDPKSIKDTGPTEVVPSEEITFRQQAGEMTLADASKIAIGKMIDAGLLAPDFLKVSAEKPDSPFFSDPAADRPWSGKPGELYEFVKKLAPDATMKWEEGQGGFAGQEGMMQITRPDGTVEVVNEAEWRAGAYKRKQARKRQAMIDLFDANNGLDEEGMPIEINVDDSYDEETVQLEERVKLPSDSFKLAGRQGYKFARAVAVKFNTSGNIEEAITTVLADGTFGQLPPVESPQMKTFFKSFWRELSKRMQGNMLGGDAERLIKAIVENEDGRYKVEHAQKVWVTAEGRVGGGEGAPVNPELIVASQARGQEKVIKLSEGGKLVVDSHPVIDLLTNLLPSARRTTDEPLRQAAWKSILKHLGSDAVAIPFDNTPGPVQNVLNTLIRELRSGKIPTIEVDPPTDVDFKSLDAPSKSGGILDDERVDQNDYEHLQETYSESTFRDPEGHAGGGWDNPDTEIFSNSVKQGKLLGLLQPDMLFPKFSPGIKRIDLGLRTPKGNALGGGLADVGVMALQGNLTPENALFSAGLNSVGLLTKSPLKAGLIGSTASLAVTAATGGDLGRALFGITGSIIGGALGGFASGGIGTLGGSMVGGTIGDEAWKALFGSNSGMRPVIRPVTPDIPNVRIP